MEITEVNVKIVGGNEKLKGFCSIIIDKCFVVRDMKIINGDNGIFVAMPSRKIMDKCPRCSAKNHIRAKFCNQCGESLSEDRVQQDNSGRFKLFSDIAHPINSDFRQKLQKAISEEYEKELERSKLPGYVSKYNDLDN